MKKSILSRLQAIGVWWVVFYLVLFIISRGIFGIYNTDKIIKTMIYIIEVPSALLLSIIFYFIGFKMSIKTGINKYYKYYVEFGETNSLSENSVNELVSDFETEIRLDKRNEIIYLLSTYYLTIPNPNEAIKYLKQYDLSCDKEIQWSISAKQLKVSYVLNYMCALLALDDLDGAKHIYNDWISLLNEFINDEELGSKIKCTLAEYHLNFLDGANALSLLEKTNDFDNKSLKLVIACDKAMAYRLLKKPNEERHWLDLAYGYCENDFQKERIDIMLDSLNKRINEYTQN